MTGSRAALGLALFAMAAGGAWLALHSRQPADSVPALDDHLPAGGAGAGLAARPVVEGTPVASKGACTITGTVRLAGRPVVAGVEARLSAGVAPVYGPLRSVAESGEPSRVAGIPPPDVGARTAEDGTFRLDGLAAGVWSIRAFAPGGAQGSVLVTLGAEGTRRETTIDLVSTSDPIHGSVLRADGSPWRGIVHASQRVGEEHDESDSPSSSEAVVFEAAVATDEKGAFSVGGLVPGSCQLWVEDAGIRVTRTTEVPRAQQVALTWLAAREGGEGRVEDDSDGHGIAGATIRASVWARGTRVEETVVSDAEGRFRLALGPPPNLEVQAKGYVSSIQGSYSGHLSALVVRLARTGTILGRATHASDGRPVAGLVVEATRTGVRALGSLGSPSVRAFTDAAGRYELAEVAPGEVGIRVHSALGVARGMSDISPDNGGRDMLDSDPLSVSLAPGGTATLDLVIEPAARVAGVVTDADGAPAAGVLVRAWCPHWFSLHNQGMKRFWEIASAATGLDGRYALLGLIPGRDYVVQAQRDAQRVLSSMEAPPGGTEATLDFQLPPSAALDVIVVDVDSHVGVPGVELSAHAVGRGYSVASAATGDGGWARLGPMERSESVSFRAEDPWEVIESDAVATASVLAKPVTVHVRKGSAESESMDRLLEIFSELSADREARGTNPLEVRVLDEEGKSVPRAQLHYENAIRGSGGHGEVEVVDGAATISRPGDGRIVTFLSVAGARDLGGVSLPLAVTRIGPVAAETKELEIRLPRGREILGRVLDARGLGVAGLRVVAVEETEEGDLMTESRGRGVRTAADGGFRIAGLGEGTFLVVVAAPTRYAEVWPVRITTGDAPVEISMVDSVDATISVTADKKPAARARIYAWPDPRHDEKVPYFARSGRDFTRPTGADGKALLRGLAPYRKYRLNVELEPQDPTRKRERTIVNWSPEDTTVDFAAKRTIRGSVHDRQGVPVADAYVHGWTGTTTLGPAKTDASGAFALPDEGTGLQQVYATMSPSAWGRTAWSGYLEAPEGDARVDMVLDPGLSLTVRLDGASVASRTVFLTSDVDAGTDAAAFQFGTSDETGLVVFRGLSSAYVYSAWVEPQWFQERESYDRTCGQVLGLKASASPVPARLNVTMGGTIRVHLKGVWSSPYGRARHGRLQENSQPEGDSTLVFEGLCDLDWTITVDDGPRHATAVARPGTDLTLEPEAPAPK